MYYYPGEHRWRGQGHGRRAAEPAPTPGHRGRSLPVPAPTPTPLQPVPSTVVSFLRLKVTIDPTSPAPCFTGVAAESIATEWLKTVRAWRPGATATASLANQGTYGVDGTLVWLVATATS